MPFPLNRFIFPLLFLCLSLQSSVLSSGEYFETNWPAPGARYAYRNYRRNHRYHLHHHRVSRRSTEEIQPDFFSSLLGECFRPFFLSSPQQTSTISSYHLPWDPVLNEYQKECEICFEVVDLSNCPRCCTNGHRLHTKCFAEILAKSDKNIHKCPLCRQPLHANPRLLQRLITNTSPEDTTWDILVTHLKILKIIKTDEVDNLDWKITFHYLLTDGEPLHLQKFLNLNLVDVNTTFDVLSEGYCAIAVLLRDINIHQMDSNRVERLMSNLHVLLNHPEIILNRMDRNLFPSKHLIFRTIDSNVFEAFLIILDSSHGIDFSAIFRYVCKISNREIFFNYLLTCNSFDLFAADKYNCSSLHFAIRFLQTSYTIALLESPHITTDHLLQADSQNGRTALHYAMNLATESVVDKMLTFPGINWDLIDFSGQSINDLYIKRMNEHY